MKYLSIDTSTKYSVVALGDEGGLRCGIRHLFEKGRADGLLDLISSCFKRADLTLEEIDVFGVGAGPGSFTGLRIGISTVKGFGYALNKPCVSFSSLDAIAFRKVSWGEKRLCVLVDARRSNVYCRFYQGEGPGRESGDLLIDRTILIKKIRERFSVGEKMVLTGDGVSLIESEFMRKTHGRIRVASEEDWFPTPESLARLTLEATAGGPTKSSFDLSAVYLYEKDCQVKKKP